MNKLALNPEYGLYEREGKPFCDSLQVAETFGKRHDHVIRDIETKILDIAPKDFTDPNFGVSKYKDESGKNNKMYLLTRDAFSLVTMGFTGKKAMDFKITFIQRFNDMERFIKSLTDARFEFRPFTDAVMAAHDEPKFYHYSNELDMINRIVLGVSAKQYRETRGIEKDCSIRPFLNEIEIGFIRALQMADVGMLELNLSFAERKEALTRRYAKLRARKAIAA